MSSGLLLLAAILWAAGAVLGLAGALMAGRIALALGAAAGVLAAILALPTGGPSVVLPGQLIAEAVGFRIDPQGWAAVPCLPP